MTVYGKSFNVNEPGVVADGWPESTGLRATGGWGADITGSTIGVITRGQLAVAALGDDEGVVGHGRLTGVRAEGGIGLKAVGTTGPAGTFSGGEFDIQTGARPQIHIDPQPMWVPNPIPAQGQEIIPPDNPDVLLPVNAQAGDVLLTSQTVKPRAADSPPKAEATLWLCVVTGSWEKEPAVWKQVLLGPSIKGTKEKG